MDVLHGELVTLRPATEADLPLLRAALATPEVWRWWGDWDPAAAVAVAGVTCCAIVRGDDPAGDVIGMVQWEEEHEPDYRHAGLDLFLDPAEHGHGYGGDAVRTIVRWLIEVRRHHRIVIDPAAGNAQAIACYERVGFKPVGVMRRYERGPDGEWHDGLLMDLLADEFTPTGGNVTSAAD